MTVGLLAEEPTRFGLYLTVQLSRSYSQHSFPHPDLRLKHAYEPELH